jgi:hypothetical protein
MEKEMKHLKDDEWEMSHREKVLEEQEKHLDEESRELKNMLENIEKHIDESLKERHSGGEIKIHQAPLTPHHHDSNHGSDSIGDMFKKLIGAAEKRDHDHHNHHNGNGHHANDGHNHDKDKKDDKIDSKHTHGSITEFFKKGFAKPGPHPKYVKKDDNKNKNHDNNKKDEHKQNDGLKPKRIE